MLGVLLPRLVAALAAIPFLVMGASAQTTGKAAADIKPLLENDRLRVVEMEFQPGEQAGGVSRPNRFVYALTDGSLVFAPPGKTPYELSFSAGEALWLPSESTATINENDKPVRALVIEFKEPGRPAAKAKGRAKVKLQVKKGKAAPKAANSDSGKGAGRS